MTRSYRLAVWFLVAAAVSAGGCSAMSERRAVREAEASMRLWLELLDTGQYEAAWHKAAPELQGRSTIEEWVGVVKTAHPPGKLTRRFLAERKYLKRLGSGPEGRYVNLVFEAFFEDGTTFGELTTLVESDGQWRVYGYKVVGARRASAP